MQLLASATAVAATATPAVAHYFLMRHANEINIIIGSEAAFRIVMYRAQICNKYVYKSLDIY